MEIKNKIFKEIYTKTLNHKKKGFIIVDGITCSGKTSFSKSLRSYLKEKKVKSVIISKDLFLKSRKHRIKLLKMKSKSYIDQNSNHYDLLRFKDLLINLNNEKKKSRLINLEKLYNRKTGLNDATYKLNIKPDLVYIIEGLYILNDLPKKNKIITKILLINDLYNSLSKKFERIRDKSINLESVIYEFKKIHLRSFLRYIKKNNDFNYIFDYLGRTRTTNKKAKSQSLMIENFLKRH